MQADLSLQGLHEETLEAGLSKEHIANIQTIMQMHWLT